MCEPKWLEPKWLEHFSCARAGQNLLTPRNLKIIIIIIIIIIIFTGFPAGTIQFQGREQLQQKISNLSVLVASQMDITSYRFGRFKWPPRETS